MYKILLTGFEPFAGMKTNVSRTVANLLGSTTSTIALGEFPVGSRGVRERNPIITWESEVLSVDSDGSNRISRRILSSEINDIDAIIHLGLARNANNPLIETRALNLNKFILADNQGRISNGEIIDGGPSEIPVTASIDSIRCENLKHPFEFSNDAGGFVCNETLYNTLLSLTSTTNQQVIPCLFIHLPSEEIMSIQAQVEFVTCISAIVAQPRHVDVVGAMFEIEGKWLASKRNDSFHDGKWEFPGGKIEADETEEMALIRECKEELDCNVKPIERLMVIEHEYSNLTVTLHFWRCESLSEGPPAINSHSEHQWIKTESLHEFDWLEADKPLIKYLQSGNH